MKTYDEKSREATSSFKDCQPLGPVDREGKHNIDVYHNIQFVFFFFGLLVFFFYILR